MKIVQALPNRNIYFIPDENLGRYIASKVPDKHFIFNEGFCHVHKSVTAENIMRIKALYPQAEVLMHPECTPEALETADYIGSTSGIIEYATKSEKNEFIVATEVGVLYKLKCQNPDKSFYGLGPKMFCPNMKKITLEKIRDCLKNHTGVVEVDDAKREKSLIPLKRMLDLAK